MKHTLGDTSQQTLSVTGKILTNSILFFVLLALNLIQFLFLPLLTNNTYVIVLALGLIALTSNTLWSLVHECIHGNFSPNTKVNLFAGRILALVFGAPFYVLQFAHLMHHRYNRYWDCEYYDPQKTNGFVKHLGYYSYIFGGVYLMSIITAVAITVFRKNILLKALAARYRDRAQSDQILELTKNYFLKKYRLIEIKAETLLIVSFATLSFYCYGKMWYIPLAIYLVRALFISFFDNVYHYNTPVEKVRYARELALPRSFSLFILYFNHHGTHHETPSICWQDIGKLTRSPEHSYDGNMWSSLVAQLKGPLVKTDPQATHSAENAHPAIEFV